MQSSLRIVAAIAVVATMPLGVVAGRVVYDQVSRYGDLAVRGDRVVEATVLSTDGASATNSGRFGLAAAIAGARPTAEAMWTVDGRQHRGRIGVPDNARIGDRLPVDVESDGVTVVDRFDRHDAAPAALFAALGVVAAGVAVPASCLATLRRMLDRQRAARWESEWATLRYR